ncbi:transporter [Vibrio splendidus]|uniref:vWA domain-containing protein n=1 Tax=Vibrio splendidus TaxID=29497 RepID=UPI00097556B2|nr:VWA domain-containing protein [Vibrio splendidus]OMO27151.1 transporter [Vibrio splendidus]
MIGNFHFLRPEWLLLIVPLFAVLLINWRRSQKRHSWVTHLPKHLSDALRVGESSRIKHLPILLLGVIGIISIVVAAGPSWYRQSSPFAEDTTPLVVVLDVSESMLQQDVAPSRLFRAKKKIAELIDLQGKGKTALVVYSGTAHLAMPLTQDIEVFTPLLDAIQPHVMPREGKFAEYTLPVINKLISETDMATVLLVTDAVNQQAYRSYQDYFNETGHQLLIYGVGNPDVPSPLPMEAKKLSSLASAVHGDFIAFTQDDQDIQNLSGQITSFAELSTDQAEPWFDASYPLVWLVLVPYLLWFRKGWLVQWCFVASVFYSAVYSPNLYAAEFSLADIWLTKDQQGALYYREQDYQQAAQIFDNEYWKATAYYQAGEYEVAQQFYMRSDTLQSQLGAAASLVNLKEFVAARSLYRDILEQFPEQQEARHNLKIVEDVIAYIDNFTEGQSKSSERQVSRENGDKPKRSEGVEQQVEQDQVIQEVLSAEDILNDPRANDKWMKRVQSDLSNFITTKFALQHQQGLSNKTEWNDVSK